MVAINKTVGTPGNMSLCTGKAIFLINGSDVSLPLGYQSSFTVGGDDEPVSFRGDFFAGICGPAWALKMDMTGQATGNQITLDAPTYDSDAGTLCGASLGLTFDVHFSFLISDIRFSVSAKIDLLEALLKAVELVTGKKLFPEVPGSKWSSIKSFGFNDSGSGTLGSSLAITRQPAVVVQWDLWLYILYTTAPEAVKEWDEVKWLVQWAFGPEIKTTLNVELKMTSVTVDTVKYTGLQFNDATRKITGTTAGQAPATADVVQVTFHEVPSISFGIGIFGEFRVVQVFSVRFDWVFPILENLGYGLFGEYDQTVDSASVGAACDSCSVGAEQALIYDVEFV